MARPVDDAWTALEEPWRASLELAWEAYRAGTVPVGAVVVDGDGAIVSRGRNRILEPRGIGLAGTRLAHAEVEALAALPVTDRYADHALYSVLEPCLLCVGAALMSTIGSIRYAAADPYGGACRAEIAVPDFLRRGMHIDGPLSAWPGRLAGALSAAFWLGYPAPVAGAVLDAFGDEARAAGVRIAALDVSDSLEEALPRLLDCLEL